MSDSLKINGSCLCKSVNISVSVASSSVGACHCSSCRKWGGGPLLAIDCGTEVTIDTETSITVFNSSEWAERGFCTRCGTHLFYRLKENQQYSMPAGIFDDVHSLNFDHQIFIDEKPEYYDFNNDTKNMTGAEVFALYSQEN
ncbi:MAG: GFA family protein [Granulosicoccus sp.]